MGRVSKYRNELRGRAVPMVADVRRQYPSQSAAITAVAGMPGSTHPMSAAT
jgi:transposase